MNGRPNAIKSATPPATALLSRLLCVAAVTHERAVKHLAKLGQGHWFTEFMESKCQAVHDV